jgi:hypothetical protein
VSIQLHHIGRERQFLSADTSRCDRAETAQRPPS